MRKRIKAIAVICILFSFSCTNQVKKDSVNKNGTTIYQDTTKTIEPKKAYTKTYKHIRDIEKDSILEAWTDSGSFWLLSFKPGIVEYEFNPSCGYWFPSKVVDNEIIFYWALNPNCTFDRGLKKTFKGIRNPVVGKPFGKIKMTNDSTLVVDYFYNDWVNKVNQEEIKTIDTLFPRRFKKIHL